VRFRQSLAALGLLPATHEPRVTRHIPDIIACVRRLEASARAYVVEGTVFFDVTTDAGFGRVSHLDEGTMIEVSSRRGANPSDPRKRHALDFILWQAQTDEDDPAWTSPWGPGRPGWHIECTAMAMRLLGKTIDLHGGGEDLVFPHHECSAAQSEAMTGQVLANHWMHAGMVCFDGEKMSKSLGNVVYLDDVLEKWEPCVVRLALLANHYRTSWTWAEALLKEADERVARWRAAGRGLGARPAVRAALNDDLDTPAALDILDAAVGAGQGVSVTCATLLGVQLFQRQAGVHPTFCRRVAA